VTGPIGFRLRPFDRLRAMADKPAAGSTVGAAGKEGNRFRLGGNSRAGEDLVAPSPPPVACLCFAKEFPQPATGG